MCANHESHRSAGSFGLSAVHPVQTVRTPKVTARHPYLSMWILALERRLCFHESQSAALARPRFVLRCSTFSACRKEGALIDL
jgi:hypothetical protein